MHRYLGQGVVVEVDGWIQEADLLVDQDRAGHVRAEIDRIHEEGLLLLIGLLVGLGPFESILIL